MGTNDAVIIGGRADKGEISRMANFSVVKGGKYAVGRERAPASFIIEPLSTNTDVRMVTNAIG